MAPQPVRSGFNPLPNGFWVGWWGLKPVWWVLHPLPSGFLRVWKGFWEGARGKKEAPNGFKAVRSLQGAGQYGGKGQRGGLGLGRGGFGGAAGEALAQVVVGGLGAGLLLLGQELNVFVDW